MKNIIKVFNSFGRRRFILACLFLATITYVLIAASSTTDILNQMQFYNHYQTTVTMHKMANTKITADAIWDKIRITAQGCEELIEKVEESDYDDKKILLKILNRWKNEDFTYVVWEHNYLWERLGGTVGKAVGTR